MSRCSNLLEKFEGLEKFEAYSSKERVQPKTLEKLEEIIEDTMEKEGNECDLNFIDTSKITDMDKLFGRGIRKNFNGDISKWDVSKVRNMFGMFSESIFNGDISKWDVSNVENMAFMFNDSKFNKDISKWNVSKVKDMFCMFCESKFNGDISKWDVSKVKNMSYMFDGSEFNGDISKWDVSNVKSMGAMFQYSKFNGDISKWDVSNVKTMDAMFKNSKFNGDISKWEISKETDTGDMFKGSPLAKKYKDPRFKAKPIKYNPYSYDWTEEDEYALYDPYGQWGDKLPSKEEMENAILDAIEAKMTDYAGWDGIDPDKCSLDKFYRYSEKTEYPSERQFINIIYKPYEDKYGSVEDLFKSYKKSARYKKFKRNLLAGPAGWKLRSKGLRFSSY